MTASREPSIDILRGVAIVLMVLVHFVENLSGWYGSEAGQCAGLPEIWWLPTGFAAPTFTFLVGVSYRLWLEAQRARGCEEQSIHRRTVRRGLLLFGLGLAFNVLIWLPEDIFNWDILTLIGCGLLTLDLARRMPTGVVMLAAGLIAAVAPAMRATANFPAFWTAGYYDYDFTVADVALGWLVTGYFPIFPWLAFPLAGYALAPQVVGQARSLPSFLGHAGSLPWFATGACFVILSLALVAAWPSLPRPLTGDVVTAWTMFPASTAYISGTLGGASLALGLLHRMVDGQRPRAGLAGWLIAWAGPLGRHSLSIYLVHHAIHIWPLWAAGLATSGEPTAFWQVAMPPAASLALAVAFLVATAVLCRWADGRRLPSAEALMRRSCR